MKHHILGALVLLAAATTSWAQTIDKSGGFAANGDLTANGTTSYVGAPVRARLTPGNFSAAGSVWSTAQVDVTGFSTSFTFQMTPGTFPMADGLTFTIQRVGPNALGGAGSSLGYFGIGASVCVKFDNYPDFTSTTGLFTGGVIPDVPDITLAPTLDFHSQNVFRVDMTYDGITLAVTITDTVTTVAMSQSYLINIPATIGGNTAHVGFTAATGGLTANHDILTWVYGPPPPTIGWLKTNVNALLVPSQISASNKQLLINLLNSAQLRVDQGRPASAVTLLRSFITYVNKFQGANLLAPGLGGPLVLLANQVITGLLGP